MYFWYIFLAYLIPLLLIGGLALSSFRKLKKHR